MRNHDAKIQASEGVKSWINSSKSIDTLFERVVASCAKNRLALKGNQEPAPVSKTSYSTQDISRVEQASDWVRKYLSWREDRKALGFPAGTQAFLDQLGKPLPLLDDRGCRLRSPRGEFPTPKTLRDWVSRYEKSKLSLAGNYAACGRPPQVSDTVLLSFLCAHTMFPRLSIKKISENMKKHPVLSKLPGISASTLSFWRNRIPQGEWNMLQRGEAAHYQSSHAGSPIPAKMPGDLIQVDAGVIKVWVQDHETGEFGYPHLLAAIDVKTRAYLGGVLTFKTPTTADTLLLLRNILLPRKSLFHQLLTHPKQVQFDNGSIFNNQEIKEALLALNIDCHYIEGSRPTSNAVVERGFRLIGDEFASLFVRNVEDRGAWGGTQKVQAVRFDVLSEELDEWLENYNFSRPHSKHDGATPAKVWRDLTMGRCSLPDEDKIRTAMTLKKEYQVTKNGAVELAPDLLFEGDGLRSQVSQRVVVRVTPDLDPTRVDALIGNNWVRLHSIHSSTEMAKKLADDFSVHKSGLLQVRRNIELLSGLPREAAPRKPKAKEAKAPVSTPPKQPKKRTSKSTPSAPLPSASSFVNPPFTLVA